MKKSEERYRTLFEFSPEAIVLFDTEARILDVNGRLYDWLGYKPKEVIGKSIMELPYLPKGSKAKLLRVMRKRMLGEVIPPFELDFTTITGGKRIGRVHTTPIEDKNGKIVGELGMISDITEQKQVEEALRESEEKFRVLVEHQGEGIGAVDEDEYFLFANPAAERIFGVDPGELVGRNLSEFVEGEAFLLIQRQTGLRRQGQTDTYDLEITRPDGERRQIIVTCAPRFDKDDEFKSTLGVFRDYTERARIEETLRTLYRAVEHSPSVIAVTDRHGIIEYVNPKFTDITGYTADEAKGKNTSLLKSGEHTREFYENLWATILSDKEWRGEFLNRKKDGGTYWEHASICPIKDRAGHITHFVKVAEDMTARKQAEEEVRQRTAQLEALREVGLEITAELEMDALLRSIVSRAVELLQGTTGDFYLYKADQDVLEWELDVGACPTRPGRILHRGEDLHGRILEEGDAIIVNNYPDWEGRLAANNSLCLDAVVGVPVRWREEFLGVLTVAATTPRSFSSADAQLLGLFSTEAAIAIRNARLVHSLRDLNDFKDALMGIAAHDLSNPLTHVTGYLDLLTEDMGDLDTRQAKWLRIIRHSLERMKELINGLLNYQSLTLEKDMARRPFDLNAVAERVVVESEPAAAQKSHQLTLEASSPPPYVLGDEHLLHAAIGNLVSNAIKYTPPGGLITVRTEARAEEFGVLVKDTGPGIAVEEQEELFQPFTKLKSAEGQGGIGLGLSLVKTIVERHGGHVSVDSRKGSGAIFSLWLPKAESTVT